MTLHCWNICNRPPAPSWRLIIRAIWRGDSFRSALGRRGSINRGDHHRRTHWSTLSYTATSDHDRHPMSLLRLATLILLLTFCHHAQALSVDVNEVFTQKDIGPDR